MPTNKNAQLRYQILDRCFSVIINTQLMTS